MAFSKICTIFAGVNGAGKSTLYNIINLPDTGIRLNSDELIRSSGLDWRSVKVQLDAGQKIIRLQNDCFDKGLSFNRETTLCGNSILKTFKQAKDLGYTVKLYYVGVNNPEIAKQRVAKRIALGGHGVSEATIERRYAVSIDNFIKIYEFCDIIDVYDNSADAPQLVAYKQGNMLFRTDYECEWADDLVNRLR